VLRAWLALAGLNTTATVEPDVPFAIATRYETPDGVTKPCSVLLRRLTSSDESLGLHPPGYLLEVRLFDDDADTAVFVNHKVDQNPPAPPSPNRATCPVLKSSSAC